MFLFLTTALDRPSVKPGDYQNSLLPRLLGLQSHPYQYHLHIGLVLPRVPIIVLCSCHHFPIDYVH